MSAEGFLTDEAPRLRSSKVRENLLRRVALRRGMLLQKSRRRDVEAIDFGGFMLVDALTNTVVEGGSPFAFSMSLDEVETYLREHRRR